ncbi:MAG TPA: hypothetical protein VFU40_00315 [Gemmatimonadales bacterium]|nr:hypothetical protein [Gemmatimonadales bacterium]
MPERLAALLLVFGLLASVHLLQGQSAVSDSAAIHESGRRFSAAYMRGDVVAMGAMYTPRHAYDYGTYLIAGERDGVAWGPFSGKYVAVWRRDPGAGWRMELDIWNSRASP